MSFKGKINVYTCPKGHKTITIDRDEGVTPFMMRCKDGTEKCDEMAMSSMYRCDQTLTPEFEWFKPASFKGYSREMRNHLEMGGLDLRKIQDQKPDINKLTL